MKLNHLSLAVPDVAAATSFFERYFDFRCISVKGNHIIAILSDDMGFTLVLTYTQEAINYPADFHFGFFVTTEQEVYECYDRMHADGVILPHAPRSIRGNLGFYFHIPGGVMAEVSCQAT